MKLCPFIMLLMMLQSVHIDDKSADKFKSQVLLPINASFVIQLVLFGVGGLLLLASMIVCCIWIRGRKASSLELSLYVYSVLLYIPYQ